MWAASAWEACGLLHHHGSPPTTDMPPLQSPLESTSPFSAVLRLYGYCHVSCVTTHQYSNHKNAHFYSWPLLISETGAQFRKILFSRTSATELRMPSTALIGLYYMHLNKQGWLNNTYVI